MHFIFWERVSTENFIAHAYCVFSLFCLITIISLTWINFLVRALLFWISSNCIFFFVFSFFLSAYFLGRKIIRVFSVLNFLWTDSFIMYTYRLLIFLWIVTKRWLFNLFFFFNFFNFFFFHVGFSLLLLALYFLFLISL